MYYCSECNVEVNVDHINPPKFNCVCVGAKVVTAIEGHAYGKSHFGATVINNNISEASAMILKNTLFALAANEFFINKKKEIEAKDLRVKDSETGREFSFTLIGKEV
jgi:hypothetical protein